MDIRDLKVFQMITVEKSVSKAAKKLYMTPQGVSKILKNLETEISWFTQIRISKIIMK